MNKILILILLLLAGVGAILYTRNPERNTMGTNTLSSTTTNNNSNACDVFAKTDIEQIWGVSFKDL